MYLSLRYSENRLETLRLGCGQFVNPELRSCKLLHCPWTVFLFSCLLSQLVNFSLKCIYSYSYEPILFILYRNHPQRAPPLACALPGNLAIFGDLSHFCQKMVIYRVAKTTCGMVIYRLAETTCACACWKTMTCTPPFVNYYM